MGASRTSGSCFSSAKERKSCCRTLMEIRASVSLSCWQTQSAITASTCSMERWRPSFLLLLAPSRLSWRVELAHLGDQWSREVVEGSQEFHVRPQHCFGRGQDPGIVAHLVTKRKG